MSAHWNFVVAAYAVAALIIGAMIVWVAGDYRRVARRLDEMETRNGRRRSAP